MEVGDRGLHGTPALLPVAKEFRPASVSALTLPPNLEERIVLVRPRCLKCATNKTVLLVSTWEQTSVNNIPLTGDQRSQM